jgi:WD40 repeat protein
MGPVRLWHVATEEQLAVLPCDVGGGCDPLTFSPDAKLLVGVRWEEREKSQVALVWDVAWGELLRRLRIADGDGSTRQRPSGYVLPDNNTLVLTSQHCAAVLYDLTTGKVIDRLQGHDDVLTLALSRDGKGLATFSEITRNVIVWDLEKRKPLLELNRGLERRPVSLAFSPDGKYLAAAPIEQGLALIVLWDLATKKDHELECVRKRGPEGEFRVPGRIRGIAFSADGKHLIVLMNHFEAAPWEKAPDELLYWDVQTKTLKGRVEGLVPHGHHLLSFTWSPDARTLALGEPNSVIRLFDVPATAP